MKPNVSSSILLTILPFLLFFCAIDNSMAQNESLIQTTCKTSAKNDPNIKTNFCITSLQASPASRCASLHGLEKVSIRLLLNNVTDTRRFIKHLVKNKNWNQFYKQRLNDCFELYSDAMSTVKQAMKSFKGKKYNDVNIQISAVMSAATTCQDGFQEGGNGTTAVAALLKKRNDYVFQLGAIGLSVLSIVQAGSSD